MNDVTPSERIGPKSVDEISDATLENMRCAAVGHANAAAVASLDKELERRSRRQIRR